KPRIGLKVRSRPLPDVSNHLLDTERARPGWKRADPDGLPAPRPEVCTRPIRGRIPPGVPPARPPCSGRGLLPFGFRRKPPPGPQPTTSTRHTRAHPPNAPPSPHPPAAPPSLLAPAKRADPPAARPAGSPTPPPASARDSRSRRPP